MDEPYGVIVTIRPGEKPFGPPADLQLETTGNPPPEAVYRLLARMACPAAAAGGATPDEIEQCFQYWEFALKCNNESNHPESARRATVECARAIAATNFGIPDKLPPFPETVTREWARRDLRRLRKCCLGALNAAERAEAINLADAGPQYVTLIEVATWLKCNKRTLSNKLNADPNAPHPDVEGGGGKAHQWIWSRLRPWLATQFNRQIPDQFPSMYPAK